MLQTGEQRASTDATSRCLALDSLRGLCALWIVAYHFNPTHLSLTGAVLGNAYLFVDFFFVLSGFVIARAYSAALGDTVDVFRFLGRRIARIYPLHLAMLIPYLAVELMRLAADFHGAGLERAAFTGPKSLAGLFQSLFLVQGMGLSNGLSWNGPSWSIACEFWVYVVFAVIVQAFGRRWTLVAAALAVFATALLFILPIATMNVTYDIGLVRCLAGFMIGALLSQAIQSAPRTAPATLVSPKATLVELAVAISVLLFVSVCGANRLSLLAPVVFAMPVLVFSQERGALSRLMRHRWLVRLGTLSYSIYMIHAFLVYGVNTIAKVAAARTGMPLVAPFSEGGTDYVVFQLPSALAMDLVTAVFLAAVVALASFTWAYVEQPGRLYLNRVLDPRRQSATGMHASSSGMELPS